MITVKVSIPQLIRVFISFVPDSVLKSSIFFLFFFNYIKNNNISDVIQTRYFVMYCC
ncbi:hypothetical protein C2G38_666403 [Gigaspora rosea]|uniref:Uncharacterized protein n=1 Tax=Gigaspora rosea TaxID=44941 RepID=A0A397U369_9GLOM|nr:hypothetical protein C2G38_666403 [Gigaspora rosea]